MAELKEVVSLCEAVERDNLPVLLASMTSAGVTGAVEFCLLTTVIGFMLADRNLTLCVAFILDPNE